MRSGLKTSGEIIYHTQSLFLSLGAHNSINNIALSLYLPLLFERRFSTPCQILLLCLIHLLFVRFASNVINSWFLLFLQEELKKKTNHNKTKKQFPQSKYLFLINYISNTKKHTDAELQHVFVKGKEKE